MRPFSGGELNQPIREPLHSHFGNMTLQLYPPLIKQDFYQQYHQPTFWPYCESLEECVVYRQAHNVGRHLWCLPHADSRVLSVKSLWHLRYFIQDEDDCLAVAILLDWTLQGARGEHTNHMASAW